ncbi:MAG: molybdopterin molybdotransferase MoeA [Thermoguttaceae bacterium]|jgi:molybdopterin molybdotransferase
MSTVIEQPVPAVMVSPDHALGLVRAVATPRRPSVVAIEKACGLILAESISADRDYPPFHRALMDGYAVRAAAAGKTIAVIGEISAGQTCDTPITDRGCLEIFTGARCPPGTEVVVPKEHVRREGDRVTLPMNLVPGQHIAPAGSECRAGHTVFAAGQRISGLAVAAIVSVGCHRVQVIPRPRVAIITTGAELVAAGQTPHGAQIRDSNGPMLAASVTALGLDFPQQVHVHDQAKAILDALQCAADCDLLLLSGGVSAGKYDLVPAVLQRYGATQVFHKVTQKPGKPLLLARKAEQLIFGLPGNPLAAHLCFHRYVRPAVQCMEGRWESPPRFRGLLAESVRPEGERTHFVPAVARGLASGSGSWSVRPLPELSSGDVFSTCGANCYLVAPPGRKEILPGTAVEFFWTDQP